MQKLKVMYFGTPALSGAVLQLLLEDTTLPLHIVAVVTQPDRKVGRKQIVTASPVKKIAQEYAIPIIENFEEIKTVQNSDLGILFAYGNIIPDWLLKIPKHGFWNIHPSLLPKYRGASPITFPLLMGETQTGVTLMQMDELLDHGDIIEQKIIPISEFDKRPDIEKKSVEVASQLVKKYLSVMAEGKQIPHLLQNHKNATFSRQLHKEDGYISFPILKKAINGDIISQNEIPSLISDYENKFRPNIPQTTASVIVYRLFRGLFPWPGIWTSLKIKDEIKRLKITDVEIKNEKLIVKKVQLEGKKEVDFATFQKAYIM